MAHKAEILSDAEVDFLMTAEKAAAPLPTPGGEDQAVTMRGDLEQINLADIFQTLAIAKMEGVLRIRNPLEERQVHVRDGFLRAHVPAGWRAGDKTGTAMAPGSQPLASRSSSLRSSFWRSMRASSRMCWSSMRLTGRGPTTKRSRRCWPLPRPTILSCG